jgi:hypothetical protein
LNASAAEHNPNQATAVFKLGRSGSKGGPKVNLCQRQGAPRWRAGTAAGHIPDRVKLIIQSENLNQPCHVVWRKERRIGVTFD